MINEPGYYGWMMSADFPLYTKQCLKAEMDRIKAESSQNEIKGFDNKLDALKNKFKKCYSIFFFDSKYQLDTVFGKKAKHFVP